MDKSTDNNPSKHEVPNLVIVTLIIGTILMLLSAILLHSLLWVLATFFTMMSTVKWIETVLLPRWRTPQDK